MAMKDMKPDLEKLDSHIDSLEDALKPLIDSLPQLADELPLLDKAKMFALSAYAIESLLFSALRLQGVDAKDHHVMTELKRVQQYFGKIKNVEETPAQRTLTINTEAATRILKADLGENDKGLKKKLEEKLAEERAKALLNSIQKPKRPAPDSPSASSSGPEKRQRSSRRKSAGKKNNL
ncbi:Sas10/Utp3/C1D family protein [Colletotrichum higginsianum IMI 349063]|uniref:Exosome complex protein n=3 Tax=Colletotrichum higginsianum TaxID=80884 RepID=A0A1B7Y1D9_COLHI|nr:Sas10/Utp3/C1D family protein [Colletotrichum higginsianum IMI 349063]OBR05822.1 Sas10/Utp3/C1D family protein [Colletotrichum higginsianum IMI 349063]TIC90382.1 Exosome complex protein [Colletotrichum higginsianum]